MFVYIQLRQRADIYLEFILVRKLFRQFRIQAVNSLDHQDVVRPQLLGLRPILLMSRYKVETRYYNLPASKQFLKLTIEQFNIYSLQAFEIKSSRLILRILFPLHKIIIHGNRMRRQSIRPKLN